MDPSARTAPSELSTGYQCPHCSGQLELRSEEEGGALECPSGHRIPVIRGIPRFVSDAHYTRSFGRQWNRWATTQLDSSNGTTIFRERFYRYFGRPESLAGLRVLDGGCGAGAFIDVVAPHADEIFGIDLSDAVDAAHRNSARFRNVQIAQADIFSPPFVEESFDFVYCIGVLQHTPDPRRAFASLARLVKRGGRLGVWIYERSPWEPLKPRHLLRTYTTRLEPERAMPFIERYAPRARRVRRGLAKLPGGGVLHRAVPVADVDDYVGAGAAPLSAQAREEWCLMDTHDMLVTTYDNPQRPDTVAEWFRAEGFEKPVRGRAEALALLGVRRS
jgi:SAM-dependent methyltransferase